MEKLSNKPSEAILQAIEDLEWCEQDPRYRIDMDDWHTPVDDVCYVCQAGAILTRRVAQDRRDEYLSLMSASNIDIGNREVLKIKAFDELRNGYVEEFLIQWGVYAPHVYKLAEMVYDDVWEWVKYNDDEEQYKDNMRIVSRVLKEEGY